MPGHREPGPGDADTLCPVLSRAIGPDAGPPPRYRRADDPPNPASAPSAARVKGRFGGLSRGSAPPWSDYRSAAGKVNREPGHGRGHARSRQRRRAGSAVPRLAGPRIGPDRPWWLGEDWLDFGILTICGACQEETAAGRGSATYCCASRYSQSPVPRRRFRASGPRFAPAEARPPGDSRARRLNVPQAAAGEGGGQRIAGGPEAG